MEQVTEKIYSEQYLVYNRKSEKISKFADVLKLLGMEIQNKTKTSPCIKMQNSPFNNF